MQSCSRIDNIHHYPVLTYLYYCINTFKVSLSFGQLTANLLQEDTQTIAAQVSQVLWNIRTVA